jgi:hypothetical protein
MPDPMTPPARVWLQRCADGSFANFWFTSGEVQYVRMDPLPPDDASRDVTVIESNRAVIEGKLLAALEDKDQVAILVTREDLFMLREAMVALDRDDQRAVTMRVGLKKLWEAWK